MLKEDMIKYPERETITFFVKQAPQERGRPLRRCRTQHPPCAAHRVAHSNYSVKNNIRSSTSGSNSDSSSSTSSSSGSNCS